tara:strand:- start:114207 stop:114566 length:360 start_codon:yes stop_codon:yes gene_type:complete
MSVKGFGKELRLLNQSDFDYLKTGSKSISTKWLRIYFKPSKNSLSNSRIGLAVSKKVGNAVKRNIVKRAIRETFRTSEFKDKGLDIIFIASPYIFKNDSDLSKIKSNIRKAVLEALGKC